MEPELEAGTYRPYLVCQQTIAPDATAVVWIDGAVQTLDIGGNDEAHFRMTSLDPLDIGEDVTVEVSYEGANDRSAKVDAIVFQPGIEYRVAEAENRVSAAVRSFVDERQTEAVSMPIEDHARVEIRAFDEHGKLTQRTENRFEVAGAYEVPVEPRGFSVARADPIESSTDDTGDPHEA